MDKKLVISDNYSINDSGTENKKTKTKNKTKKKKRLLHLVFHPDKPGNAMRLNLVERSASFKEPWVSLVENHLLAGK